MYSIPTLQRSTDNLALFFFFRYRRYDGYIQLKGWDFYNFPKEMDRQGVSDSYCYMYIPYLALPVHTHCIVCSPQHAQVILAHCTFSCAFRVLVTCTITCTCTCICSCISNSCSCLPIVYHLSPCRSRRTSGV